MVTLSFGKLGGVGTYTPIQNVGKSIIFAPIIQVDDGLGCFVAVNYMI